MVWQCSHIFIIIQIWLLFLFVLEEREQKNERNKKYASHKQRTNGSPPARYFKSNTLFLLLFVSGNIFKFLKGLDKVGCWVKNPGHVDGWPAMHIIVSLHSVSLLWKGRITIWKWAEKHCRREPCVISVSLLTASLNHDTDTHSQTCTHTSVDQHY